MNRTNALLFAVLVVVAATVFAWRAPGFANSIQDDGFIYFRIAENLATGHGPVFNPGERVDAATSPIWLWTLAGAKLLRVPLHAAAAGLGLIAAFLCVLACARWSLELANERSAAKSGFDSESSGKRRGVETALALSGALAIALDDRVLVYAFSGMETLLCAAVWLWATRMIVRRWIQDLPARGAGWWALAAALVRPEYVLIVFGVAAMAVVRSGDARRTLRAVGVCLVPAILGGVVYLAAHTLYFGDPLPNTYYAKRASDWAHASIGVDYVVGFVRAYPWVVLVGVAWGARSLRPVLMAVGAGLFLFTAHIIRLGGDHFEYYRSFIHVLPICAALVAAGAACVVRESLGGGVRSALRPLRDVGAVVAVVGMVFLAARTHVTVGGFHWVSLAARLGVALAESYPPETRVGLFALGATGYTSRLPVVDALGIADKYVAQQDLSSEHVCHLDIGHERGDPEYVLEHADVVVFFAAFSPVAYETLEEVRDGFHSHKKFVAASRLAIREGRFVLKNIEFMPGVYWAVLERAPSRRRARLR